MSRGAGLFVLPADPRRAAAAVLFSASVFESALGTGDNARIWTTGVVLRLVFL
ncbi:hypothetical protein PQR72_30595 [Paraburkholderia madseniana]|uniref:hypothetical protein n=1 Tax=Paraburkholderia madseniana TaxID=2599607 RepID=UPI0015C544AB|nr:hypothetical protein [Paraburkholderia madseniana]NPT68554.1 hypothetical protein [Paraburkholderia madseniana]